MTIVMKTAISFIVLLLLTRLLGKKQMNQITYFDYITGITLGSIAASIAVEEHVTLKIGGIAFLTWAGLDAIITWVSLKSYWARNFLDGQPDIIIKKGALIPGAVKKAHLNMDDVAMMLREKDIFSIADVDYAILEPHGKLSVLRKAEQEPVSKKDMNVAIVPSRILPADLIIDGKIIKKNLAEIGRDEAWLNDELMKAGLAPSSAGSIFYMAAQEDGSVYICFKQPPAEDIIK